MNEDRIKGQRTQLSGRLKARWDKLTDGDLKIAKDDAKHIVGKLQQRHGTAKDGARKQMDAFEAEELEAPTAPRKLANRRG